MRDLAHNISVRPALAPASYNADAEGNAIDRLGFFSLAFSFAFGAFASGSHAFALQHRDEGEEWGAVPAEALIGALPVQALDSNSPSAPVYENRNAVVGYIGDKRYVRANVDVTGGSAIYGIDAILGDPQHRPTS